MLEQMSEEEKEEMRQYIKKYKQKVHAICQLIEGMEEDPFDAMVALMISRHAKEQHRDRMKVMAEVKRTLITDIVVETLGKKDDVIKEAMNIIGAGDEGE